MSEFQLPSTIVCPQCKNRSSTVSSNYKCDECGNDLEKLVNDEIASTNFINLCVVIGLISLTFLVFGALFLTP